MLIDELSWNSSNGRYGYNGKENDNEVKGTGKQIDFGARIFDTRVSRFLSLDPLKTQFAFQSPYIYAGDSPINSVDKNGEYKKTVNYTKDKDGSFNILSVKTNNDIKYYSWVIGGIPVIPNTVEYVFWDDKGNKKNTSGELKLKNIGSTRYPGPFNSPDKANKQSDYDYPPINSLDLAGMIHDKTYDYNDVAGFTGAIFNTKEGVILADLQLIQSSLKVVEMFLNGQTDPVSKQKVDLEQATAAASVATVFYGLVLEKIARVGNPNLIDNQVNMVKNLGESISRIPESIKSAAYGELERMNNINTELKNNNNK